MFRKPINDESREPSRHPAYNCGTLVRSGYKSGASVGFVPFAIAGFAGRPAAKEDTPIPCPAAVGAVGFWKVPGVVCIDIVLSCPLCCLVFFVSRDRVLPAAYQAL